MPEYRSRIRELRAVSAAELRANPKNYRTHPEPQREALRGILGEVGIADALLAYETPEGLTLIDGHLRLSELADAEIPVLVLDVTEAEANKLLVTLDPLAAMAEMDAQRLDALLREVETGDQALAAVYTDLAEQAGILDADEPEIVDDEVPEPLVDPITKPGDLWILGDHRLLCGDSTKADDVERLMGGSRADLCFTSPPYNLGKSVALRNGARSGASSAYNEDADNDADAWYSMMTNFIDLALVQCEVVAVNVQLLAGNKRHLLALFGSYATHTVDVAVWVKLNPQPAMAPRVMTSAFEFVWLLTNGDEPTRAVPTANFDRGTFSNVVKSATASGHDAAVHGAVFPLSVAAEFVGGMSAHKSIVYEPFCGSGTTLIAAEQLGRKCYGMEISPQYCDVIVKRWETLTGRKATRA
jgi:DNA modification methylase